MTAHISGHLKISDAEFSEHYHHLIRNAINAGHNFVVGDARGVDTMAQEYLFASLGKDSPRVTVFHMFDSPRVNRGFQTKGGFTSDEERDAAMTVASDYDIAWIRPGRETSGTAKNIERRRNKQ